MNLTITPNLFHFVRNNQTAQQNPINNKYPNLAPLREDTVSFGVGEKQLKAGARLSKQFGMQITSSLEEPFKRFTNKLESAFSTMKATQNHPDRPIYKIKTRIKSPESIAEKGGAREVNNLTELTEKIQDMIGGRLIMRDTSKESIETVLKKFEEMVLKGELSIVEIENFYGDPKLSYVTTKQLQPLKKACEKMVGHIRVANEEHPMGYNAIHMTVKFQPNKYGETYAEIQIMGSDIAALKDVEDLTYKIRCNKAIQKKYEPLMKYLKPLQEDNDILKNAFKEYTRNAYLYQRRRKSVSLKELQAQEAPDFLPLPWIIPNRELDFNFLYKKMKECEETAAKAKAKASSAATVKAAAKEKTKTKAEKTQPAQSTGKTTTRTAASKKTREPLANFDEIV